MKDLLLRDIIYIVYCIYFDKKPGRCSTLKEWIQFVKDANKEHFGDCTDECNSCVRCTYEELVIKATQIRNYLKNNKYIK